MSSNSGYRLLVGNRLQTFSLYAFMILAAVAVFFGIREVGENLPEALAVTSAPGVQIAAQPKMNALLHVLLALAVVIVTARVLGAIFKIIHQPTVIGEVLGGILLGPSFLGAIAPGAQAALLPEAAAPFLSIISQLGVILYMFLIGLELDLRILRRSGHATLAISHASIVLPFLLGAGLAIYLYPLISMPGVRFTSFSLFLGVSMSVTAFPVLARILADRKIHKTRLGAIALTCAAVDDVTAWCLLAVVVSVVTASLGGALTTLVLTVVYILVMYFVGRPLVARLIPLLETFERVTEGGMAIILVTLLMSALVTELIGIHAIFGAFMLGAITPSTSRVAHDLTSRLEDLVRVMFLPAFFAFTGMRTQIGLLDNFQDWKLCGIVLITAIVGKFGGATIAARLTGLNWRESSALGVLMNTRGLVELIVLNIGLDLKVISPSLFTMLVIMALVTTFMTTPILHLLTRKYKLE